ncbi:unnamed protein product [Somion occarium]|uniref:Uncharacterized protein n=1 Tax=Somion occarium TaxID=3059160 RepID=A0ABP1DSL5_9APHY
MASFEPQNPQGNFQQCAQSSAQQQGGQERQDWLDKGIEDAGQKAGVNISNQNADKAGDFVDKEFDKKEGFNLPGVH